MKNIKVLSFGTLIKEFGGNLTTGLSLVMWKLAFYINNANDIKVVFAVTDFNKNKAVIEGLDIVGWTKLDLIKHILRNISISIRYLLVAIYLCFSYRMKFIKTFVYLVFFDKSIREVKPELLHIHGTNYIYYRYLDYKVRKSMIITIHGMNGFDVNIKNYKFQRKIEKLITNSQFKKIIFITSELKNQWIDRYGIPVAKTNVILNAFDENYFYYKSLDDFSKEKIIISTVARIYSLKGQERVIIALSQLKEKNKFIYWVIGSGDTKYTEKLKKKAQELGIDIAFWGPLEPLQVAEQLRKSDYMILPSSSEGFGIAYIESIACGTKVIIPQNLPLSKEEGILNHQNSIFLKDSSISSITECLSVILNEKKYSKFEVAQTVKHLNWSKISEEYTQMIRGL